MIKALDSLWRKGRGHGFKGVEQENKDGEKNQHQIKIQRKNAHK